MGVRPGNWAPISHAEAQRTGARGLERAPLSFSKGNGPSGSAEHNLWAGSCGSGAQLIQGVAKSLRQVLVAVALAVTIAAACTSPGWGQVGFKTTQMLQGATIEFGQQITSLTSTNESSAILVKIAPGGTTGRLMHPVPIARYLPEGTVIEVRESGGQMVHHAGTAHFDPINTLLYRVGALPAPGAPSR
jgi:hypothetical protein